MTDRAPSRIFQVCAGGALIICAAAARQHSVGYEEVAAATGFPLAAVATMIPTLEVWWPALAGAGLALLLFPLKRYRIAFVVLSVLYLFAASPHVLRPTYGTDQRVLLSTSDVPGVPITYARPNEVLQLGVELERGRMFILSEIISNLTAAIRKVGGYGDAPVQAAAAAAADAAADLPRKAQRFNPHSKIRSKSFDLQPMTAEEFEATRQHQTSGTLRPSPAFGNRISLLDPR
ncbi:hypothetical protein E4T66_18385 [Sinimarinibacterium sp. CAU 1509]|uniref:hypothetical protein n=1 Tax=Sinimarinibacterium sp. CAU 1509 TaxID=2562283 RepID=UPI0010ACDE95|nr:hypothetical protein [Sinimarinibacterium sp. CAU 1509]TJY57375.1 hypothetical protein E4T66_18385 [Sinimarinibacterium sp. CAU 1509]